MWGLRLKLSLLILPLCLIPLIGISSFSYFQAKQRITEDRIALYLEQIAQGVSDTIRLTLLEKREETVSMGLFFRDYFQRRDGENPSELLNRLLLIHEVYDVVILFDVDGDILAMNTVNRHRINPPVFLDPERLDGLIGRRLPDLTPDSDWLKQVRSGRFGYVDWHQSPIVEQLYDYRDRDIALRYCIGFASPIIDDRGMVLGGILALMNWEFLQEILDHLEDEMASRSLRSGYAFLFGRDVDTIIAHKYRLNRDYQDREVPALDLIRNNYRTSLLKDHGLKGLHEAARKLTTEPFQQFATNVAYEYPPGTEKISGLVAINHEYFQWVCGVGINDEDIFAPVQDLKRVLVWAAVLTSLVVVGLTFWAARQISTPVKELTEGANLIAAGDLSERVKVRAKDEIGELANTFNKMARALQERSEALLELNRRLEQKVEERTRALRKSHQQVETAYRELQETQVQLVQSEKMASLGQLVAGIAHEIKNPLNFIYGNTDFLRQYVDDLKELIRIYEKEEPGLREDAAKQWKEEINFQFLLEDLETLIANFEEGARRIHAIIGDLRAFSRLDSEEFRSVDVHEPIELALNLIRHEYRDRVEVHREYSEIPRVDCHAGRLSQVFMNLIANACQAIEDQGDIWIRTGRNETMVTIEVEDNGPGIPPEHLNKVFEPFFTTKPVGEGTGLGLSISYGIIQQHNGTIEVSSEPGKGTVFRIRLPLKR